MKYLKLGAEVIGNIVGGIIVVAAVLGLFAMLVAPQETVRLLTRSQPGAEKQ